jgi:hypothetical protein
LLIVWAMAATVPFSRRAVSGTSTSVASRSRLRTSTAMIESKPSALNG